MCNEVKKIKYLSKRMIKMMAMDSIGMEVPGLSPLKFSFSPSYFLRAKVCIFLTII